MASKPQKEEKVLGKNALLAPRCLGIVLKEKRPKIRDEGTVPARGAHPSVGGEQCPPSGGVGGAMTGASSPYKQHAESGGHHPPQHIPRGGRDIFEGFIAENEECFWNPELEESIHGIRYLGVLLPCTLVVGGRDEYLDTIREAWARKIIKPPPMFVISKLGDIDDIVMQVIPQTQFTPLPDALCLIISDLERWGILASFPEIQLRLCEVYRGMHQPPDDLIHETLAKLMKEGKVFQRGPAYHIITPEMLQYGNCPVHDQAFVDGENGPFPTLYIPIMPPPKSEMVSISCQTQPPDPDEDAIVKGDDNNGDVSKDGEKRKSKLLERSNSLKSKSKKEKEKMQESFSRSSSLRYGDEKARAVVKDINLKTSDAHQDKDKGDNKPSLLSKLFGRSKKKSCNPEPLPPEPSAEVEYATFSAQFPPPEWIYYQQQIENYVQNTPSQQVWNYMHGMVADADVQTEIGEMSSVSDEPGFKSPAVFDSPHKSPVHHSQVKTATLPQTQPQETTPTRKSRQHKQRSSSNGSRSSSREVSGSPFRASVNGSPYHQSANGLPYRTLDQVDPVYFSRGQKQRSSGKQWRHSSVDSPEHFCQNPVPLNKGHFENVDQFKKQYSHLEKHQPVNMYNVNENNQTANNGFVNEQSVAMDPDTMETTSSCTSSYPQTVIPMRINSNASSPGHHGYKDSQRHTVSRISPTHNSPLHQVNYEPTKHSKPSDLQCKASPSRGQPIDIKDSPSASNRFGDVEKRAIDEPTFLNNGMRRSKHLTTKQKIYRYKEMHCPNICKGDISIEYQGKMQRRRRDLSKSCDSGVNCVGLSLLADQEDHQPHDTAMMASSHVHSKHNTIHALVSPDREFQLPNTRMPIKLQDTSLEDSGFNSPRTTEMSESLSGKPSSVPCSKKPESRTKYEQVKSKNRHDAINANQILTSGKGQLETHKNLVSESTTNMHRHQDMEYKQLMTRSTHKNLPPNSLSCQSHKTPPPNTLPCQSQESLPGLASSAKYPSWGNTIGDKKKERAANLSPTHQACVNLNLTRHQQGAPASTHPDHNNGYHRNNRGNDQNQNSPSISQKRNHREGSPTKTAKNNRSSPTTGGSRQSPSQSPTKAKPVSPITNNNMNSPNTGQRSKASPGSPGQQRDYQVVGVV